MSCVLLSDHHINLIVAGIRSLPDHAVPERFKVSPQELGEMLSNLNVDAFRIRYPDEELDQEEYVYMSLAPLPLMYTYKLLRSLHYQVSEGDIPNWPIYADISSLLNTIAHMIIANTQAYEKAPWFAEELLERRDIRYQEQEERKPEPEPENREKKSREQEERKPGHPVEEDGIIRLGKRELRVEPIDGGKRFLLHGRRGGLYVLLRMFDHPEYLRLYDSSLKPIRIEGWGHFTDRNGVLEAIG